MRDIRALAKVFYDASQTVEVNQISTGLETLFAHIGLDELEAKGARAEAAEAACIEKDVVLRSAIGWLRQFPYSENDALSRESERIMEAFVSSMAEALAVDVGKAMLERFGRLEQAEGLLKQLVAESTEPGGQCAECTPSTPLACTECNMGEAHGYFNPEPKESDYDSDDNADADDPGSDNPEAPKDGE